MIEYDVTLTKKSNSLTIESLAELALVQQSPCLSLYQTTHSSQPGNQQDPIRFHNLVKKLEISLQQNYPSIETKLLIEPFIALAHNDDFWNHTREGLAVLGGSNIFRVFRLQRPVAELAIVADSFYIRPLRRFLQSVDHYQILGLSLQKIQLFEGNRDTLNEVDTALGVPLSISEALGAELTEPHQTVASYGGLGQGSNRMHHSHGGKKDEMSNDTERFFREVDRAILEHHSRPSGLPLILAALPQYHNLFRRISINPFLIAEGLTINPDVLSIDKLRKCAWQVVEPQYQVRLAELTEEFEQAQSQGLGDDDLVQVTQAAIAGRVATLLIEADYLLDDNLGDLVEKMGGKVLVIPAEQMPGRTGLAATYRY